VLVALALAAAVSPLVVPVAGAAPRADRSSSSTTTVPTTTVPPPPQWQAAWTSPMDLLYPYPADAAFNATVRDIATVAIAGTSLELRLSNTFGTLPVTFGAVTVAAQAPSGGAAVTGPIVPVTFGGHPTVTVQAGQEVTSDPVALAVHAGEAIAVSLWVPGATEVDVHDCCAGKIVAYSTRNGGGNQVGNATAAPFVVAPADLRMSWLSAVSVSGTQAQGTVVALGDSITEGFMNKGLGWPEVLVQRVGQLPPDEQMAVVDEGISGNTLTVFPPGTTYARTSGGIPGVQRLDQDALDLPGTKDVVVFLGTNDIWFGGTDHLPTYGTAQEIIAGMQQVVQRAHQAGVKVFAITLLPRSSSFASQIPAGEKPEVWTPAEQATLEAVNAWLLGPGTGFDGVVNLAAVMADVYDGACQPTLPYPPYFTADNLHPNTAGQVAMADAIPTTLFGMPEAPQIPPVVQATPTPGCPAAAQAAAVIAAARQPAPATTPSTSSTSTTHPQPARHAKPPARHADTALVAGLVAAVVALLLVIGLVLARLRVRRRRARRRTTPSPGLGGRADGRAAPTAPHERARSAAPPAGGPLDPHRTGTGGARGVPGSGGGARP
jgi:lysophospholipase L1-like esterase